MSDAAPADVGLWAVVEIMGRRTRAGLLSDAQLGGATLLRIEHPTRTDHTGTEPLTEYYGSDSIFAIRPCSREEAERVAGYAWPAARSMTPELAPVFQDLVDAEEVDDDPDDDEYPL
ncbi:MAG TPA: hypothetical protein VHT75_04170 [Acidimicrobiales bacterium]|jgi:hypothetical protein|nr:hypothetical protein [Acidimicrobiales bacterium]